MHSLTQKTAEASWFMAINHDGLKAETIAALSPRVMQWSEDTWLVDVGFCVSYWQSFGRAAAWSLEEFWVKLLQHIDPDAGQWRCVLAHHPWLAVLGVATMKKRHLHGFFNVKEPFARSLLLTPTWSVWFETVTALEPHFIQAQTKGFHATQFRQQLQALQRSVERLGVSSLNDLKQIQASSMNRRFGRWLALIWEWQNAGDRSTPQPSVSHATKRAQAPLRQRTLFETEQVRTSSLFNEVFPWCSWTWAPSAQVQRHLDYAVLDWAAMEPLLQTDFLRLTKHSAYPVGHHVVGLEWRIVRHDMSSLVLPISFRHPYNPLTESPHFRTALLQTYYRFCEQQRRWPAESDDVYQRPIISWTLTITETLRFPDAFKLLFEQYQSDLAALVRLENLLPVSLDHYQLQPEFIPECSYRLTTTDAQDHTAAQLPWYKAALRSLQEVSLKRPLFLYEQPIPFAQTFPHSRAWRYGERCSEPWWQTEQMTSKALSCGVTTLSSHTEIETTTLGFSHERDYYRMVESSGEQYWVYRRSCGQWFSHGIFA